MKEKSSSKNSLYNTENSDFSQLKTQIDELTKENITLKKILIDHGLTDIDYFIADVEFVCISQIAVLKELAKNNELTPDQVRNLDILHKNLKACRTKLDRVDKNQKDSDPAVLIKLVEEK